MPRAIYEGLFESEAKARLAKFGFNELPGSRHQSILKILLKVLQEPVLLLLVACGVIYLASGDPGEGILLFGSAVFVVTLTLYQEAKSERALEALRDLSSPRALVFRDGAPKRVPGREVVPGDLIRVGEGDRVPADSILVSARHLAVDESILTGESFSVTKAELPDYRPAAAGLPGQEHRLLSGTLVVAGQGQAIVYATGRETRLGGVGRLLAEASDEPTPLQRELGRLIRAFSVLGAASSLAVALIYGLTRGDWLNGLLAGLATAMALLPEEFPVVLTAFMALGAWRLARRNVLTRRAAAIEALGAISSLCVDKTGTLTLNQMSVRYLWRDGQELDLRHPATSAATDGFRDLAKTAALACNPAPFDPMERAILGASEQFDYKSFSADKVLVRQYPLSAGLLAMTCVWRAPGQGMLLVATKGAPEAIVSLCHLDRDLSRSILEQVHRLASQGMRVLAVARGARAASNLPEDQHDFDLDFLGLIALEDPVRPEVPASIQECKRAGIRVIMLTGDYPETARSIARQLSLPDKVLSGSELAKTDDLSLREKVREVSVYARVSPDQKLRIITALKSIGERVAMTGDGVNDAPSLKWADIGVAMGGRGTDVARESSDLVLLDDRFTSIVSAIHQGRRIFDNLQKSILFVLAVHVPIAGLAILPVLLKLPLLFMPAHIAFLVLLIDPACSLIYELEEDEAGLMSRPPRPAGARLVRFQDLVRAALQGGLILALVFGLYFISLRAGRNEGEARALAFLALIFCDLGLILVTRSKTGRILTAIGHANKAFNWIGGGAVLLLSTVLAIPSIRSLFAFGPLGIGDVAGAFAVGVLALILCSLIQRLASRASP